MFEDREEEATNLAITLALHFLDIQLPEQGNWIEGLNIGHLTALEQDNIVEDLRDALGKRTAMVVARKLVDSKLSAQAFKLANQIGDSGDFKAMYSILLPVVPDLLLTQNEVIQTGLEEYKDLVANEVRKRQVR
jgi:hypothetical protein